MFRRLTEEILISDFLGGAAGNYIDEIIAKTVNFFGRRPGFEKEVVLQETRLALLINFKEGKYRYKGLKTYVTKIAENQCLIEIRSLKKQKKYVEVCPDPPTDVPSPGPNPEDERNIKERWELALKILRSLDKRCRQLLILRYHKDLSYEAVAERLSITINNAMVSMHRCLEKCKDLREKMHKTL